MRQPEPLRDPRRDADRPVRSRARSARRRPRRARAARRRARPRSRRSAPLRRVARTRARPGRGRRRSSSTSARRARRASRPSCAGPAPRTRRRVPRAPQDRPPPGLVLAVPGDRPLEPVSKSVRARQPVSRSSLSVEPMCRSTWPEPLLDVDDPGVASRRASSTSRRCRATEMSTPVATFSTSPATASIGASIDRLDRLGVVVDVEPVAAGVPVAVDRQRLAVERLRDEARHDLLRVLPRPVVVERPHDHDRQPVRDEVRVGEPVAARLRRRVRASAG